MQNNLITELLLPEQIRELGLTLDWPIEGQILSYDGDYISMIQPEHFGIDIISAEGSKVSAPMPGAISYEIDPVSRIFGMDLIDATIKYVGLECYLRHLDGGFRIDDFSVKSGDFVGYVGKYPMDIVYNDKIMKKIIEIGSIDHLHLEFSYRGRNIDPLLLLKKI